MAGFGTQFLKHLVVSKDIYKVLGIANYSNEHYWITAINEVVYNPKVKLHNEIQFSSPQGTTMVNCELSYRDGNGKVHLSDYLFAVPSSGDPSKFDTYTVKYDGVLRIHRVFKDKQQGIDPKVELWNECVRSQRQRQALASNHIAFPFLSWPFPAPVPRNPKSPTGEAKGSSPSSSEKSEVNTPITPFSPSPEGSFPKVNVDNAKCPDNTVAVDLAASLIDSQGSSSAIDDAIPENHQQAHALDNERNGEGPLEKKEVVSAKKQKLNETESKSLEEEHKITGSMDPKFQMPKEGRALDHQEGSALEPQDDGTIAKDNDDFYRPEPEERKASIATIASQFPDIAEPSVSDDHKTEAAGEVLDKQSGPERQTTASAVGEEDQDHSHGEEIDTSFAEEGLAESTSPSQGTSPVSSGPGSSSAPTRRLPWDNSRADAVVEALAKGASEEEIRSCLARALHPSPPTDRVYAHNSGGEKSVDNTTTWPKRNRPAPNLQLFKFAETSTSGEGGYDDLIGTGPLVLAPGHRALTVGQQQPQLHLDARGTEELQKESVEQGVGSGTEQPSAESTKHGGEADLVDASECSEPEVADGWLEYMAERASVEDAMDSEQPAPALQVIRRALDDSLIEDEAPQTDPSWLEYQEARGLSDAIFDDQVLREESEWAAKEAAQMREPSSESFLASWALRSARWLRDCRSIFYVEASSHDR